MADVEQPKTTEDPNFKPGVMSPKSKQTFAAMQMQKFQPIGKHKIVFDENTFESLFLQCSLCKERFNHSDRSPRMLPCHHCFCLACVMDFYWREEDERRRLTPEECTNIVYVVTVTCPTCSNSFVSTLEGLQELVADHRIIQLLDFIGTMDKHCIEYCSKHLSQPLNFFCERCACRICRDCIVIDHKQCSADKVVLDYHTALQKYEQPLSTGVKEMEDEAKSLNEKKEECLSAKEGYTRGDEEIVKSIKETFEKLRIALAEREEKLIAQARREVDVKEYDFDAKVKEYETKENEVKDLKDLIAKSAEVDDISVKYKAYTQLKQYRTEPAVQKEDYEHKSDKTVLFNDRDEVILTSKITNFGEIESKINTVSSSYGRSGSIESGSGTGGTGSSYLSNLGSYSSGRPSTYGNYLGSSSSSLYSGSSYSSRYSTRSYRY